MLQPGSPCARRFFAEHPMVLQIGRSVFVHAGLHPEHAAIGIDALNAQTQVRSCMRSLSRRYHCCILGHDLLFLAR